MSDILTLDDVRITYHTAGGGVPAVRGVDMSVKKGEVLGLAGRVGLRQVDDRGRPAAAAAPEDQDRGVDHARRRGRAGR